MVTPQLQQAKMLTGLIVFPYYWKATADKGLLIKIYFLWNAPTTKISSHLLIYQAYCKVIQMAKVAEFGKHAYQLLRPEI